MVWRPVLSPAARTGHDPLPHVEVINLAARFDETRNLFVVLQAQTVVDEIVVKPDAEQTLRSQLAAHHINDFVEECHAFFKCAAAIFVVTLIGLFAEEIREQKVETNRQLDTIHLTMVDSLGRGGKRLDHFFDLCRRHGVRDQLRRRKVRRWNRRRCIDGLLQIGGAVGYTAPAMAELCQHRHAISMRGFGEFAVDGRNVLIVVGHRAPLHELGLEQAPFREV